MFLTFKLVLESARWGVDKGTDRESKIQGEGTSRGTQGRIRRGRDVKVKEVHFVSSKPPP